MEKLIERLLEYAKWADTNVEWVVLAQLGRDLREAAEYIIQKEEIETDDGK